MHPFARSRARRTACLVAVGGLLAALASPTSAAAQDGPVGSPFKRLTGGRDSASAPAGALGAGMALEAAVARQSPVGGVFGASSAWRTDVSGAPLAANSATLAREVHRMVTTRYNGVAAFNVYQFNTPFYRVPPGTRRADVKWDNCQGKKSLPPRLYDPRYGAHFAAVPVPDQAVPSPGTDGLLAVWDPATDQLWEFWKARRAADGWHACWGGRLDHVATAPGFFPDGMGASATGLATPGGMVGIAEARAGRIDHALALPLPGPVLEHHSVFSYPAQRSDGYNPAGEPHRLPEGTRLRLDPALDVDQLPLSPIARMVARAAQKYGFIVTDRSGAVTIRAESGAEVERTTGVDPWADLMQGKRPSQVLTGFPWDRLQVLPHDWGKPAR